jgi:uncharacterized repeat protein (TIGR03803 family)
MSTERGKICVRNRQSGLGLRMRLLGLVCLAALSVASSAQTTEVVLYTFCSQTNCTDGSQPLGGVIRDSEGNLYGGTFAGGANEKGVAYKLTPSGQETVLYNFCSQGGVLCTDGWAAVVSALDSEGNLYGTAGFGGAHNVGDVYKLTASGQQTVLHSFCSLKNCADGSAPSGAGVIIDSQGNLYGTTLYGGASSNGKTTTSGAGVVYKVDTSGNETVLYNFCSLANCADGSLPLGPLLMDSEGNLYGTTANGGTNGGMSSGDGVVYKLTPSGQETVLCSFGSASCPDGTTPTGGVVSDSEGNLYGTTSKGGAHSKGVAYKLAASGQQTVLYNFCSQGGKLCTDGEEPGRVVRDSEGNLYGSASDGTIANPGNGLVFELSASGAETVLCSFGSASCPGVGPSGVILDSEGNLYGTTSSGGANGGGLVFKLEP